MKYKEYVINSANMKRGRKCYRLSEIVSGSYTFGYLAIPVNKFFKTADAAREYALANAAENVIVHESY